MKKIISLLFALVAFVAVVSAQSVSPRYGVTENEDNTGRVLTYGFVAATDAAGNDTVTVNTHDFSTVVRFTANIVDTVNIKTSLLRAFTGDLLTVLVSKGTGAGGIRFPTASFTCDVAAVAGASCRYTIPANKSAVFHFVFNGSRYILLSKVVQP